MFTPINCSTCPSPVNYRATGKGQAWCPSCRKVVNLADIVPYLEEGEVVGILADTVGYWST